MGGAKVVQEKHSSFVRDKEEVTRAASRHVDALGEVSFWTDNSRLDRDQTELSVALWYPVWKTQMTYLYTNRKVFDAELYDIEEALGIALRSGWTGPP